MTKFTVFVDETTDLNGPVKWMTFLMKFVAPATLEIAIGLPRLIKVDSTQLNAEGLFDVFKKYTIDNQIPFSNILSISCDNATVMVGHIILSNLQFGKKSIKPFLSLRLSQARYSCKRCMQKYPIVY